MAVETGIIIFACIGGLIALALGLAAHQSHVQWINAIMKLVDENSGFVKVKQLSQDDLDRERPLPPDKINASLLIRSIRRRTEPDFQEPMSEIFEFVINDGKTVHLVWRMRPRKNEMLIHSIRWRGEKIRIKHDDINKLKEIGHESYTMWKLSQGL